MHIYIHRIIQFYLISNIDLDCLIVWSFDDGSIYTYLFIWFILYMHIHHIHVNMDTYTQYMGLCYRFQENHVISGVVDPIYQVFSVDLSGVWKHLSTFAGDSSILILIVKIYNEKMPNDSDGLIVPKRCIVHHHSLKSNPDIVWRCMKSV